MNKHSTNQPTRYHLIILPLVFLFAILTIIIAVRDNSDYRCDIDAVIAQEGDTLSGLAVRWCQGNTLKATDDLVVKYGQVIQVGQEVRFDK